jgi:hypothetical protein
MKSSKIMVAALALAVCAAIPAVGQDGWHSNGDRNRDANNAASGWHDRDYDRNRYGSAQDNARRYGFQDGQNDGAHDRNTGHSYRPEHDKNFKHADRGFNRDFSSKDQYKDWYRQAYLSGYERGYNHRDPDRDGDYDRR